MSGYRQRTALATVEGGQLGDGIWNDRVLIGVPIPIIILLALFMR